MARSVVAVIAGFVAVAGLSLATDELFHVLGIYPPWGEPMYDSRLNLLALSYRILFTILGGYITAALTPHLPMRHVIMLGAIGTVAATAGAVTAITVADLGPLWYPVALVITGFPCVWLGGLIYTRRHAEA